MRVGRALRHDERLLERADFPGFVFAREEFHAIGAGREHHAALIHQVAAVHLLKPLVVEMHGDRVAQLRDTLPGRQRREPRRRNRMRLRAGRASWPNRARSKKASRRSERKPADRSSGTSRSQRRSEDPLRGFPNASRRPVAGRGPLFRDAENRAGRNSRCGSGCALRAR